MDYQKLKRTTKNKKYSFITCVGIILIFVGASILIYDYYSNKNKDKMNDDLIEVFFDTENDDKNEEIAVDNEETEQPNVGNVNINYFAVLEIPKINLKRGLVDKASSNNNVDRNIYIVNETTLPDEQDISHIILASHSGNAYISFFRNLNKVNVDDRIYFYYKDTKYIYKVSKKYEIEKTGKMQLKLSNTSDMTLITCVHGTNRQLIFNAVLIEKENY